MIEHQILQIHPTAIVSVVLRVIAKKAHVPLKYNNVCGMSGRRKKEMASSLEEHSCNMSIYLT
jgi:hypothetical protein